MGPPTNMHYIQAEQKKSRGISLQMEGRSGCDIEVIESQEGLFLRKHAKNKAYSVRLIQQARKQASFLKMNSTVNFEVPRVFKISALNANQASFFDMEFVYGEKYSDFLAKASCQDLKNFLNSLLLYFEKSLSSAHTIEIDRRVFLEKLESVKAAIAPERITKTVLSAANFLEHPPEKAIPLGRCHGDFTLSNMLFNGSKVCLIDFLDAFVESPIQDIVKLRQDTLFHWSLMLEGSPPLHANNRIMQSLAFLDEGVSKWFAEKYDLAEWYDYLQVFNLLRILPYVDHSDEVDFVVRAIERQLVISEK